MSYTQNNPFSRKSSPLNKDDQWIQGVNASIDERGTEGVCTGDKFGGPTCEPGSKRYNLAKTFKAMAKDRKEGPSRKSSSQGYNDRLDESLAKDGKESSKKQSMKDRRDESKGMEKSKGKGAYSSDPGMSRKSSSPLNTKGHGGDKGHTHDDPGLKNQNPKNPDENRIVKKKAIKGHTWITGDKYKNNETGEVYEVNTPKDERGGSIYRKSSSPLNNTGITGLNYSKELRYNAINDITQGKGEADYGFSRNSSSPLDYGSWAHEDATRAKDLYKKGDYAHARALGIDEHDADYGKWRSSEAEHAPSRSSSKLREKAMELSEGVEQGDYDYENPRVQRLLKRAGRKDARSGKKMDWKQAEMEGKLAKYGAQVMGAAGSTMTKSIRPVQKKK